MLFIFLRSSSYTWVRNPGFCLFQIYNVPKPLVLEPCHTSRVEGVCRYED